MRLTQFGRTIDYWGETYFSLASQSDWKTRILNSNIAKVLNVFLSYSYCRTFVSFLLYSWFLRHTRQNVVSSKKSACNGKRTKSLATCRITPDFGLWCSQYGLSVNFNFSPRSLPFEYLMLGWAPTLKSRIIATAKTAAVSYCWKTGLSQVHATQRLKSAWNRHET